MRITAAAVLALCVTPLAYGDDTNCRKRFFRGGCDAAASSTDKTPVNATATYARAPGAGAEIEGSTVVADSPLARAAGKYVLYLEDARALGRKGLEDGADLDKTLGVFGAYDPGALAKGWIAYAALTAGQESDFVEGVREAADHYGHDAMMTGLANDPSYSGQLLSAAEAKSRVRRETLTAARDLKAAGAALRDHSYALQKTSWGKSVSGSRAARIARLEAGGAPGDVAATPALVDFSSATPRSVDRATSALTRALAEAPGRPQLASAASYTPSSSGSSTASVHSALTLAAMDALGSASASGSSAFDTLLGERRTRACLKTARLNLTQCVAAAHFRYEETYCMARHSLQDVGDCLEGYASR